MKIIIGLCSRFSLRLRLRVIINYIPRMVDPPTVRTTIELEAVRRPMNAQLSIINDLNIF